MSDLKTCNTCKTEKPKTEFHKRSASKDGLSYTCGPCAQQRAKTWSEANPEKVAASKTVYRKANPDKESARHRVYHAANAEKRSEYSRAYYAANTEHKAAYGRAWKKANIEKVAANTRNRRAIKRSAEGSHTSGDVKSIFESQRGKCATCEKNLFMTGNKKFHVDHIMPLAKGGENDKYNLQCLCPTCNMRKNAKDPLVWASENQKLI